MLLLVSVLHGGFLLASVVCASCRLLHFSASLIPLPHLAACIPYSSMDCELVRLMAVSISLTSSQFTDQTGKCRETYNHRHTCMHECTFPEAECMLAAFILCAPVQSCQPAERLGGGSP